MNRHRTGRSRDGRGGLGGWRAGSGRAASDIAAPHPAHTRPPTECSTADACVTHDEALDRAVRTGQIHDLRARFKREGREKTGGTAARLRTRSRVGALARPLRRARNRSPGSDDPRLRRWSHGDQPRHGPDCVPSRRCRDEPPVGSTRIHVPDYARSSARPRGFAEWRASLLGARASSPRQARESGATSTVRGHRCPRSQEDRAL